jgi:hypothetical protein
MAAHYQQRYGAAVKRILVDVPELAARFDDALAGPVRTFFDRVTGQLESMPRDAEVEGVFDDILAQPARWVEIQPLPARERRQLRRRFVEEQMNDPQLRLRLFEALDGPRPIARFEAVLREQRDELDRWLSYRAGALAPLARAWLSALGIDPGEGPSLQPS